MPAMPLAISTLFFLPFIILGVALLFMLVLFLLARIQNGRFLRPIVPIDIQRSLRRCIGPAHQLLGRLAGGGGSVMKPILRAPACCSTTIACTTRP